MGDALQLSSSDYSLAVSIFFIGYLLLEVPSNMVLSRTRPSLFLPGLMVRVIDCFHMLPALTKILSDHLGQHGVCNQSFKCESYAANLIRSIAYIGINDKRHLIALRFCLGLIEAGYFVRGDEPLTS